jgi:2-iminobutanoate/2-iminopropanoate deaminase
VAKQIIRTDAAPKPIGPYSQAVRFGDLVFVAGQGPTDPKAGRVVATDIQGQTRQTLENLKAIAAASGTSLDNALKTTCFLKDMNDFRAFNEVYAEYFPSEPPARTTIQAARLPGDILVEIELVVCVP